MTTLYFILLLIGAVLFALAAFNVVASKINLVALGLLAWVLVPLIQAARAL